MNNKCFFYKQTTCFCITLLSCCLAGAQIFPPKNYPQDYFQWPLTNTIGIVANFGELRPNHYHMGLDCRTDQKENQPVLAAAGGYIAKVKVEPYGFGQAIYINHPNGLTTLYGHLNAFYPELEKYVKEQQYRLESWKVFLDLPPGLFPVTKGQLVAYSGNTGGSQGPHLHFEVRDTKTDKCLNPSLFNFPLPDTKAPEILRLAMYDRRISVFEQSPKFFTLKKVNGAYTSMPALIVANTDKVSFAITTFDAYNASGNRNGIYEAVIYDNDDEVVGFQMDSISYDETRDFNAHIDYKLRNSGGPYTEHLSRLPGYTSGIYKEGTGNGVIELDTAVHAIKVSVKDAHGNTSWLNFSLKRGFVSESKLEDNADAFYDPKEFHPGYGNIFENENVRLYLDEKKLYDSIRFTFSGNNPKWGTAVQLKNGNTPVHGYFPVAIKSAAFDNCKDKVVMERSWNGKTDFIKTEDEGHGWYRGRFRELGNFRLFADSIPPTIRPVGFKEGMNTAKLNRLAFVITDNSEDLTFKATLDGKWLRFSNDKGKTFIYKFDEMCGAGEHELKIYAEDQVGNSVEKIYHFTR